MIKTRVRRAALRLALGVAVMTAYHAAQAIGIVVPRQREVPAPYLESIAVESKVTDHVGQSRITQVFRNSHSRPVEADFFFPVPQGASITDFVLYMDGKPVKGEVLDKDKAQGIYRDIVRQMKDPGLIEWQDKNLFRVRVFPIPANGEQKMEIELTQPLTADQGYYRYELPLAQKGQTQQGLKEASVTINLKTHSALRNIYSPTHKVKIDRESANAATVKVSGGDAERSNLLLFYETSEKDISVGLLAHRQAGKDGYFSLRISPPWNADDAAAQAQPSDYLFVVDTSGSMASDDKMAQARKALKYCIDVLKPEDRFNVVRFATTVDSYEQKLSAVNDTTRKAAHAWIDKLEARGGTNIHDALETALKYRGKNDETSRLLTVIFLTDGVPTVGETTVDGILKVLPAADAEITRVFTFGLGNDVNTHLLDAIAERSRAASDYIAPETDLELPISRFFDKISKPALVDVELSVPGVKVSEIYPPRLPDLFYGTELTVFGKYDGEGTTPLTIKGTLRGEKKTYDFEKAFPAEADNDFVEKLWATRKVAWLLDEVRKSGENNEVREEIVELANRYGIVTPYTSYLAMEDEKAVASSAQPATTPAPRRRDRFYAPPADASLRWSFGEMRSESAAAAPTASSADMALASQSGSSAVATARKLSSMRSSEQVEAHIQSRPLVEQVHGKTFRLLKGVWTDDAVVSATGETVKIQYLSDAWFHLTDHFAEIRDFLALGEQVHVVLKNGCLLHITEDGIDSVDVTLETKLGLAQYEKK